MASLSPIDKLLELHVKLKHCSYFGCSLSFMCFHQALVQQMKQRGPADRIDHARGFEQLDVSMRRVVYGSRVISLYRISQLLNRYNKDPLLEYCRLLLATFDEVCISPGFREGKPVAYWAKTLQLVLVWLIFCLASTDLSACMFQRQ